MKSFINKFIAIALSLIVLLSSFSAFGAENKFGIDVSKHNGDVNLVQQAEDGKSFVMIRIGYFKYIDEYFWINVEKAVKAKMNFGVYLFSYAYSMEEAKIEADFVLDILSDMPEEYKEYFTLPVAYDLEDEKMIPYGKQQITNQAIYFCDEMSYAGYTPMVYANLNWFNNFIDLPLIVSKGYKLWYANYVSKPSFNQRKQIGTTGVYADMWQYQAGNSSIGTLDQNVAYDLDSLMHKYALKSEVKQSCTVNGKRTFTCSICGEEKIVTKAKSGHSFNSGKVTKKATCTATGVKTYTCTVCKTTKTEAIAKKAHTYKDYLTKATSSASGKIVNKCSDCGNVKSTKVIAKISSVKLGTTSYTYDGNYKNPTVTVKDANGKTLVKGTDYTVAYSNNKYVGKATAKITFKGNYSGTKSLNFTIKPKATSISSLTAGSKKFTVKWYKRTTQTTGYQIQYATNSRFDNAKLYTISNNTTTSKSISNLTAKKKYYVRVRTYKTVNGTKYYSAWSGYKYVTTKK